MPPSSTKPRSANFAFLAVHDPLIDQLGALAERYFAEDPSTALVTFRVHQDRSFESDFEAEVKRIESKRPRKPKAQP